jgi:exosortase E/protease (VPEID-CTERM system)
MYVLDIDRSSPGPSAPLVPVTQAEQRITELHGPARSRRLLTTRILGVAGLFALELLALSAWLDTNAIDQRQGLVGLIGNWGPWLLRGVVAYSAIVATVGWFNARDALERLSEEAGSGPIRWRLAAAHVLAIVVFAGLSSVLYAQNPSAASSNLLAVSWLVAGVAAIGFAATTIVPLPVWIGLLRSADYLWAYAFAGVVIAGFLGTAIQTLWEPASRLTFALTRMLLVPFAADVLADPGRLAVGTKRFYVIIAPGCSGLEGAGLILAFGSMWLVMFRRECRFPQAAALLPAAVVVMFLLNSVRLAGLVLIGTAGAKRIAAGGFHSQAGWILFNIVAVGFCIAVRRIPFFARATPEARREHVTNATAPYLIPFLAILGAGMVAGAAASDFEWLYPLRFLAAGMALWLYRRSYVALGWRFDWLGPAVGLLVFALWIALDRILNGHARDVVPGAFVSSSAAATVWIACRVMAAVVTVPVTEELAFRGFLMRRLIAADFESVSFQQFSWFAVLVSSIVFGVLHGAQWFAGALAGLAFALAAIRSGRIGTAVWAHATCNALLTVYVLAYQRWHLW